MNKLGVQIVNINNLQLTKDCISDLFNQDCKDFDIIIVDQHSTEEGTVEYLEEMEKSGIEIIYNTSNVPLNHLWNRFYALFNYEYLCMLNNDVRLTHNFISDTIRILDENDEIGCVIHATNHPDYNKPTELNFVVKENIMQGWDFTIRRDVYNMIEPSLHHYCGDDWLFQSMYDKGFKTAIALSSPIIHYLSKSTPACLQIENIDVRLYSILKPKEFGKSEILKPDFNYTNYSPTFEKFKK